LLVVAQSVQLLLLRNKILLGDQCGSHFCDFTFIKNITINITILAVLVSARLSVVICSFHGPEQLGSVGGAFSSQLQLSGTHCHFTFARRPSVTVSFEQGSRLIFSGWPFADFFV